MLRRIRGLHKDEGGQSIVFIALTLLFVVLFVFTVINTGDITTRKMKIVNAADATAISGATWMARGYNTTAMLNVAQSQILAIIVLLKATKKYHTISAIMLKAQLIIGEILSGIPWTAPVGAFIVAYTNVLIEVDNTIKDIMKQVRDNLVGDNDDKILWDIEEGLTDAEAVIVKIIPVIAQGEAIRIAMVNGSTFGFLYPMIPMVDLKLPFCDEDDRKFEDLCEPTGKAKSGGKKIEHLPKTHYLGAPGAIGDFIDILTVGDFGPEPLEFFKAWLPYPLFRLLPPFLGFVYDAVAKATLSSMCGGSGEFTYEKVADATTSCKECYDNRNKLTYLHIGYTEIKTRFSMSGKDIDDVIETKECMEGDPSPCQKMGTITDEDGNEKEFWGYIVAKSPHENQVKLVDTWDEELKGSQKKMGMSIKQWMQYVGNDCKRKITSSYTTDYESEIYNLPYTEGSSAPNMRIPKRDSEGNIIKDSFGNIVYKKVTIYVTKEVEVTSCKYEETGDAEGFTGDAGSTKDKAKPFMLLEDWQDKKDYAGICYMKPKDHVLSTRHFLKNPQKLGMIYFSQAEVYVPEGVSAHLFNQCWKVRLVKFDMLSKLTEGDDSVNNNMNSMLSKTGKSFGEKNKFLNLLTDMGGSLEDKVIIH